MCEGEIMICISCGNENYFETEVETMREVAAGAEGLVIKEAVYEDFNHGEEMLRGGVTDNVHATLKMHAEDLIHEYGSGRPINPYLYCAICHGREVIFPASAWTKPKTYQPLGEEILSNHREYKSLKEEQLHANKLPVLWKP
jgi:hypothetical protein